MQANMMSGANSAMGIQGAMKQSPNYGFTESGLAYNKGSVDSLLNAVNQESLWKREDVLREAAEYREDTQIDRVVEAAKRNGINPIFLLDALSGNTVGNAASYTTSAAKANNYDTNDRTNQANSAKIVGAIVAAVGLIAAAVI